MGIASDKAWFEGFCLWNLWHYGLVAGWLLCILVATERFICYLCVYAHNGVVNNVSFSSVQKSRSPRMYTFQWWILHVKRCIRKPRSDSLPKFQAKDHNCNISNRKTIWTKPANYEPSLDTDHIYLQTAMSANFLFSTTPSTLCDE